MADRERTGDRTDDVNVDDLRDRLRQDEEQIAELRDQVRAGHDENELLREAATDAYELAGEQSRLVRQLRSEAGIRDAALKEMREALGAAEDELGDLRAVRDALTPPALPARPGLQIGATFLPAARRVSGDFYLAVPGPTDDVTVVVVGDVAGHGIDAARQAAFVRTAFVSTARFTDDPCRLLEWANVALTERTAYQERFATAACMTFDASTQRLRWGLAGHPPPLRLGSGEELDGAGHGLPLGVRATLDCTEGEIDLQAGAGVLLYTDGLVEARAEGRMLGVERAGDLMRQHAAASVADLLATLNDEATAFGGGTLADDLCLVAVQAT